MNRGIIFFADKLPPLVGGMELHADYFIKYFTNHQQYRLLGIITKNNQDLDQLILDESLSHIHLKNLPNIIEPTFVFFNSGRWIEELSLIRQLYPKSKFIYRTGGNEIIKAPLITKRISDHKARQKYWVEILNSTIDTLITNSSFTENRLLELGITCPFLRCVGGVNLEGLTSDLNFQKSKRLKLFCAARFVAYKNHVLLIELIDNLIKRGYILELNLAGDGPLKENIQQLVKSKNLENIVKVLGTLENRSVCQEIANSDIYIQLSCDYLTKVEGGSYIHSEGMGRSILEAISAGTFVIAGHSGALSEIVTPDRGLLVNLNDTDEMVKRVERVFLRRPFRRPPYHGYCWSEVFKKYELLMENYIENTPCH
jgi:glycosyltransferase involved in cell wall biosynthesis